MTPYTYQDKGRWVAAVKDKSKRGSRYIGRCYTKEEALAAAAHFIATDERPPKLKSGRQPWSMSKRAIRYRERQKAPRKVAPRKQRHDTATREQPVQIRERKTVKSWRQVNEAVLAEQKKQANIAAWKAAWRRTA